MAKPADRERDRRSPAPAAGAADTSVLLTGMMGSGKSCVGALLAARLGFAFVDTDEEIERRAGHSVAEIFEREGEAAFRKMETAVLEDLPGTGCVVALGGGAVVDPQNRATLRAKGKLVWLDAAPPTLVARLGAGDERPLLAGLDADGRARRLAELLAERGAAYAEAELRVETDTLAPEAVCDAVLAGLASGPGDEGPA